MSEGHLASVRLLHSLYLKKLGNEFEAVVSLRYFKLWRVHLKTPCKETIGT